LHEAALPTNSDLCLGEDECDTLCHSHGISQPLSLNNHPRLYQIIHQTPQNNSCCSAVEETWSKTVVSI